MLPGADILAKISEEPLSNDEAIKFVSDPKCGAIATFLGVTRDNFEEKTVEKLSYEAYVPMAEKEMRRLCVEARERWGKSQEGAHFCILHRIGDVPIGEASVIIAVSTPHRTDALEACAWLIDSLKASVPIWKKESYVEGDAQWKQNAEWSSHK